MISLAVFESPAVPPAGFEPALTAPEAGPVHGCYLAKRAVPVRLGSVWGAQDTNCWARMQPHLSTSVRAGGARIVVSSGLSTNSGAVNSPQTDAADRLAAAAEEVEAGPVGFAE